MDEDGIIDYEAPVHEHTPTEVIPFVTSDGTAWFVGSKRLHLAVYGFALRIEPADDDTTKVVRREG